MTAPLGNTQLHTWIPKVTQALEADAKEIHETVNEAFTRDIFRYTNRARATLEKIQGYFSDGTHTWYFIKAPKGDKQEIAFAGVYSTDKAPETVAEGNIHMISARKSYWGKKLTPLILRTMEERALLESKTTIRMIVAITNPGLIRFYAKQGYRLTGEKFIIPTSSIRPEFQGKNPDETPKIFCVHMEKNL